VASPSTAVPLIRRRRTPVRTRSSAIELSFSISNDGRQPPRESAGRFNQCRPEHLAVAPPRPAPVRLSHPHDLGLTYKHKRAQSLGQEERAIIICGTEYSHQTAKTTITSMGASAVQRKGSNRKSHPSGAKSRERVQPVQIAEGELLQHLYFYPCRH
jgi:hypothetical protein